MKDSRGHGSEGHKGSWTVRGSGVTTYGLDHGYAEEGPTITTPFAAGLQAGDVITFAARPRWWLRLAYWFRLAKPKPLKQFVVTWTTEPRS